jgi:hypothetical protein
MRHVSSWTTQTPGSWILNNDLIQVYVLLFLCWCVLCMCRPCCFLWRLRNVSDQTKFCCRLCRCDTYNLNWNTERGGKKPEGMWSMDLGTVLEHGVGMVTTTGVKREEWYGRMGGMPANTVVGAGERGAFRVSAGRHEQANTRTTYGLVQLDLHETRAICITCQGIDIFA